MTATIHVIEHIVSDPEVMSGSKHIAGTRIRVRDILIFAETGQSPEEMVEDYGLTLSQIHAALAYGYEHADEMERETKDQEARVKEYMRIPNRYTTSQAAQELGISAGRIRQLILDGRLKATKEGRDLWIARHDLVMFKAQERKSGYPKGRPRE